MRRAQHAEDAALGAGGDHARRRGLRVEAAVAGAVLGPEDGGLAVEAVDRAPDVRLVQQHARVVDQVAGGEVVGAVDDQVVWLEDLHHVRRVEPLLVQDHVDVRVDVQDRVLGADAALDRPMSAWPWMIWRCRFDSSTSSNSTMPSVPTPAAARYISAGRAQAAGAHTSTLAFFSRFCPSIPTSGMIRWREYLRTSSTVSSWRARPEGAATRGSSRDGRRRTPGQRMGSREHSAAAAWDH